MSPRLPPIVIVRVKRLFTRALMRANQAIKSGEGWARMPGARQELIGTGFEIRHEQKTVEGRPLLVFVAYDPEGNFIASSPGNLTGLKQFVEQLSRQRQEFDL